MKLSIVIPVYNEESTVAELVKTVQDVELNIDREIILVDDCSSDGTRKVLERLAEENEEIRFFGHDENRGKGAALHTGFDHATGDLVIIQDADMEYDPKEYPILLQPVLDGRADVVYGSRFAGGGAHRVHLFWHYLGNKFLTTFSNMMTNLNLTDMEVCYKLFKREILEELDLKEERFGFEVEITAKVARARCRIYEVPISYYGRGYDEGKKITWKDGFRALYCIVKYRLVD